GRALWVLAHRAFPVGRLDEDGSVLGNPAPLMARHRSSSSSVLLRQVPMLVKPAPVSADAARPVRARTRLLDRVRECSSPDSPQVRGAPTATSPRRGRAP